MKGSLTQIADAIKQNKSYKIYFHKKPDGDAIGTAHALALGLQSIGIKTALFCSDPVPEIYHYLIEGIQNDTVPEKCPTIAIDTSNAGRLGVYSDIKIDFCIDHHENNGFHDALQYVEENASSCAEVLLKVLEEMNVTISKDIANLLYVGLVTDTMCFRARSTRTGSLETAARLAAYGADIVNIARRHALMKTPERMKIESILCNSFHFTCDNRVLGSMFTYVEMERAGLQDGQLEGLNTVVEQVEGIEIGIVVRETKPCYCRVSVRTSEKYNAGRICAEFGGGGHANAAGCEIEQTPEIALSMVEEACKRYIQAND